MKIIISLLITIIMPDLKGFGQQQNLSEFTKNAKEATGALYAVYNLDVFNYYQLKDYETQLKQAIFKKNPEYQSLLTKLKALKADMPKSVFYLKLEEKFKNTDYDIKRKGFDVELGSNWGMGTASARPPKSIFLEANIYALKNYYILFKGLPSRQVPDDFMGRGVLTENMFLQINENNGLEIENSRASIDIYFFFSPNGQEIAKYRYLNSDGTWYTLTDNLLKADTVKVVVANRMSGKIYFSRIYNTPQSK